MITSIRLSSTYAQVKAVAWERSHNIQENRRMHLENEREGEQECVINGGAGWNVELLCFQAAVRPRASCRKQSSFLGKHFLKGIVLKVFQPHVGSLQVCIDLCCVLVGPVFYDDSQARSSFPVANLRLHASGLPCRQDGSTPARVGSAYSSLRGTSPAVCRP